MANAITSLQSTLGEKWWSFQVWIRQVPPPGTLSGRERLKCVIRIMLIVIRKFLSDDISLRSSALTFTIILSLVPLLALGTAVLKGFGAGDTIRQTAHRFVDQLDSPNVDSIQKESLETNLSAPEALPPSPEAAIEEESASLSLSFHLRRAIDNIFDYVDRTNFTTIGAFGVIGLFFSVLLVLDSIETAMNAVWQVKTDRSLIRKVRDYLTLAILMPLSLNLALAVEAAIRSPALNNRLMETLRLTWLGHQFLKIFPVVLVVTSFMILYRFLPNTRVRFWPALVGGLFAGGSWLMIQVLYLKLQIGVARYNTIYGSFATLPLFLLWLYLGWLIFLTGAVLSYAIQHWRYYLWEDRLPAPMARLALAFDIMGLIKEDFDKRIVTTEESLASRLRRPEVRIASVVNDLLGANILRQCQKPERGYLPAAKSTDHDREDIVDAIFGVPSGEGAEGMVLASRALNAAKKELQS